MEDHSYVHCTNAEDVHMSRGQAQEGGWILYQK